MRGCATEARQQGDEPRWFLLLASCTLSAGPAPTNSIRDRTELWRAEQSAYDRPAMPTSADTCTVMVVVLRDVNVRLRLLACCPCWIYSLYFLVSSPCLTLRSASSLPVSSLSRATHANRSLFASRSAARGGPGLPPPLPLHTSLV